MLQESVLPFVVMSLFYSHRSDSSIVTFVLFSYFGQHMVLFKMMVLLLLVLMWSDNYSAVAAQGKFIIFYCSTILPGFTKYCFFNSFFKRFQLSKIKYWRINTTQHAS